jgi:SAM-dependent methyltransferase
MAEYSVPGIGELYDHVGLYGQRGDTAMYVRIARHIGGPVLELGCGTGRVLLPTARAGVAIAGLDRSTDMLARCRGNLASESAEVQARVTLVEGDMRDFDLRQQFALVTIPFRGFQHLTTIEDQLACLQRARTHLAPDGLLVFDVFNPHFGILVSSRAEEREDTPPTALPGRRSLRRTARVLAVDFIAQLSQVELVWYVTDASGREARHVQAFPMRWFMRAELEHLVARAGLRLIAVHGDMDEGPLAGDSPEMVVVAAKS